LFHRTLRYAFARRQDRSHVSFKETREGRGGADAARGDEYLTLIGLRRVSRLSRIDRKDRIRRQSDRGHRCARGSAMMTVLVVGAGDVSGGGVGDGGAPSVV